MLALCTNVLSESILCFCCKLLRATLQFYITDIKVYLMAGVKNTNSSVIFRVSSVTFLKYLDYNCISPFVWYTIFCVYTT